MEKERRPESISFAEFTETTLTAVSRAIEARRELDPRLPIGPVLFGLIWWPDGLEGGRPVVEKPRG
jgi:hypothetical protein